MKYLLFDQKAISYLISRSDYQSIEYRYGISLVRHVCGEGKTEVLGEVAILHEKDGVLFYGKNIAERNKPADKTRIYCVDLTTCELLKEKDNSADLLTVLQKSFRMVARIWNRQPFAKSERYHETKSILFPFVMSDRRRLVIERSNSVPRLEKRGMIQPLLAYKYNAEEAPRGEEVVDTSVLREAGEIYLEKKAKAIQLFNQEINSENKVEKGVPMTYISTTSLSGKEEFIYMPYERQMSELTDTQRKVVENKDVKSPIRIDGAAGTGKTISMLLRAYTLLKAYKEKDIPFSIIFFAHSNSTNARNKELFQLYEGSEVFLDDMSEQKIYFTTLLEFCRQKAHIDMTYIVEYDASDAKNYQLLIIEQVLQEAINNNRIRTYMPSLSKHMKELFDSKNANINTLCIMLQHEFGVQIKGRTDCTIDTYYSLKPIKNGIVTENKKDKELIFSLFCDYQNVLGEAGQYDIDDVVMEALAQWNAPVWRRERAQNGYDYLFVDEMHLFNINEKSVFHYLTKDAHKKDIPICFALDYSQAIGDRGNVNDDFIERAFGIDVQKNQYYTVFRNSIQIIEFCESMAVSGTLMFQDQFMNPYVSTQSVFTEKEEARCKKPELFMYENEETMMLSLKKHIDELMQSLQCKLNEIAVISFEQNIICADGINYIEQIIGRKIQLLDAVNRPANKQQLVFGSPYVVNGLEFSAVILLGVDGKRVPESIGTSDISRHFLEYSAYNMLYLTASRAKYRLIILGNRLNGKSECLEHSITTEYLDVIETS